MARKCVTVLRACVASTDTGIEEALLEGLEFVNWRDTIRRDSVVFVKPNFTFPYYRRGVTTNPLLLENLLRFLKNRCERVILGESDGGNNAFHAEQAFVGHKMYEITKNVGAELVNLSKLPSEFYESKVQNKKVRVQLPKMLIKDVDCVISVPVLKVHVMTAVSLAIKNLWGCVPDSMRITHHQNLDRKLSLIVRLLNPGISIIDGEYGLDGHGPMFGTPIKMGLILTSNNVVVADSLGARIMGVPINRVKHLLTAEKEKLGTTNLKEVRIRGDWRKFKRQFQITNTLVDRASRLLFASDSAAKLVYDSFITPYIYRIVGTIRTPEERDIASQLQNA